MAQPPEKLTRAPASPPAPEIHAAAPAKPSFVWLGCSLMILLVIVVAAYLILK